MKICDDIIKSYLDGGDLEQFREAWYYTDSDLSRTYGKNVFTLPPEGEELRQKARVVYDTLLGLFSDFTPAGKAKELYDGLFPNWREVADTVAVDLLVGLPNPHDAVVCNDPDGKLHMLFDVIRWTPMVDYNLSGEALGIVSHELFHVLMHTRFPQGDTAGNYLEQLDQIVFHEGIAHLVQLAGIMEIDLQGERLTGVKERSTEKLRQALGETDRSQQAQFLYEANCGNYFDKYGAMAGMLYLARIWQEGGIPALREALDAGPVGFARRCC
ncbi:MAG: hypothetical protein K2F83_03890 [Oscillospiraceae bacterium]|nr:hypothetical protein [Oscillospiraceae bacterium]